MKTLPPKKKKDTSVKSPPVKAKNFPRYFKISIWFLMGIVLGFIFLTSFLYIAYRASHTDRVYDGILIDNVDFGGKTKDEVRSNFAKKNKIFEKVFITLNSDQETATVSAAQIGFGYDENLLAQQALDIGRSDNAISNMSIMLQAYIGGLRLSPNFHYQEAKLDKIIFGLSEKINIKPVDALFNFENGRVTAFKLSSNGQQVDSDKLKKQIISEMTAVATTGSSQTTNIKIPIIVIEPAAASDRAKQLGIKELVAEGTSLFGHSIDTRIFNINLAASRLNGVLIPPGQVFSFDQTVGDITALTGYKQAYVIENGKTVLGDGGGVCQVSTTLFRAALNAGLPIVERHQHAYRVGYYEEDSPPGIDAAIYSPTVDLKFKNDTAHDLLIQTQIDFTEQRLTFQLYGTKDNRAVTVNQPVILSQSPAPDPVYTDDPTLPKGTVKQIDFAAGGANVYFTRTVTKDGKTLDDDKFVSNYQPWTAKYLRGTQ